MMSPLPAALKMSMAPPALKPTTTVVPVVFPASTFRFDVLGWVARSGHILTNVVAVVLTIVRLRTMAVAPDGMLFAPDTCHISVSWLGEKWNAWFGAKRLSSARTGVMGVNALCTGAVACATHDWDTANASGTANDRPTAQRRWRATTFRFRLSPIDRLHAYRLSLDAGYCAHPSSMSSPISM